MRVIKIKTNVIALNCKIFISVSTDAYRDNKKLKGYSVLNFLQRCIALLWLYKFKSFLINTFAFLLTFVLL